MLALSSCYNTVNCKHNQVGRVSNKVFTFHLVITDSDIFKQGIHDIFSALSYLCDCLQLTHPPILSALLLIVPASRFLVPDLPLLVPVLFVSLAPLRGMTFSFLSDRNPLWISSNQTCRYFPQTINLSCFLSCAAIFLCLKSLFVAGLNCVQIKFCMISMLVCMECLCECLYMPRIVSRDKILSFINTFDYY